MTTYTNPFTGQTISPASVSYEALSISVDTSLQWPINGNDNTPVSNIIDVTATTGGLKLELPPATQVSTGQSVLVRNVGSNSFTVTDASGGTIIAVASGIAEFIFLTDNTTTNGTWASVVFGAGTSSANASALAGYGLLASGLTLNQNYLSTVYSNDITLPATLRSQFVLWKGGVGTLTMPSASSVGVGWFCMIRNSGTGILTLTPAGTDTIDGNASQQLQLTESLVMVATTTGWNTFGYGRSSNFAYTQFTAVVTGGTLTLSSVQAANTIQEYTGALTANQIIEVPATVQLYTVTNATTGAYTFTVKVAGSSGAAVAVARGTSLVLISDGTNVFNAASGSSSPTTLALADGSAGGPSLAFVNASTSGLYLAAYGATPQVGLAIGGSSVGYYTTTGLVMSGTVTAIGGIAGGTF